MKAFSDSINLNRFRRYQHPRAHDTLDPIGFQFSSTASPPLAPFLSTTTSAPLVSSTPIPRLAGTKNKNADLLSFS